MNVQHTPGPWTLGQGYKTARNHAVCSGPRVIAKVIGGGYPVGEGWSPESEADARLIVAAPDLVDALQNIEANLTGRDNFPERVADSLRRIKEALALAGVK